MKRLLKNILLYLEKFNCDIMKFSNLISEEIDKFYAIGGIVFSVILIIYTTLYINRSIYSLTGVFAFTSCVFWLLIRKRASLNFIQIQSHSLNLLLALSFFSLLTCSIMSVYFRPNLYERPLINFILISLMVGIVVLELSLKDVKKLLVLLQILLIGLSISWSQVLLFPGLVGVDPWWHQMFTSKIISIHNIPDGYVYSKLPVFHLFIASTSLITGLNYKFAAMLSVSFLQIICTIILIYLFSVFLFDNYKIGLLASLSVTITDNQIYMSYWSIPNAFGALFTLYILYILLKAKTSSNIIYTVLSILFMVVLVLTHTLASLFMVIVLVVYWSGFNLCTFFPKKEAPISLTYIILFTVSMFAWWTYVSGTISTLGMLLKFGFSIDSLHSIPQDLVSNHLMTIPLSEQIFNYIGMFLFFTLSFIGCFYMMSIKYGNYNTFNFAVIGLTPLFLGFFSLITKHSIVEQRWWYFAQVFLSIPFAVSVSLIMNSLNLKSLRLALSSFLIVTISFLLIMSPVANIDNHTFSPKSSMTSSLIASELQAVETTSSIWDRTIKTDEFYAGSQKFTHKFEPFSYELSEKSVLDLQNNLVLVRKVIIGKPFKLFSSIIELDYDPRCLLNDSYFSKMYDCGSVEGYLNVQNLD